MHLDNDGELGKGNPVRYRERSEFDSYSGRAACILEDLDMKARKKEKRELRMILRCVGRSAVGSQSNLRHFLSSQCKEEEHGSLSKTRKMLSKGLGGASV